MRAGLSVAARAVLLVGVSLFLAAASAQSGVKTGKERLGDKASDEQRVDNCKVPPDRWGKTARSASCAHGQNAHFTH
jgi:hypothetical protein